MLRTQAVYCSKTSSKTVAIRMLVQKTMLITYLIELDEADLSSLSLLYSSAVASSYHTIGLSL